MDCCSNVLEDCKENFHVDSMDEFQDSLLYFQKSWCPYFGPIVISSIKMITSIVQLIVGLVGIIFLGLSALFLILPKKSWADVCCHHMTQAVYQAFNGISHLIVSMCNLFSCGIMGEYLDVECRIYD